MLNSKAQAAGHHVLSYQTFLRITAHGSVLSELFTEQTLLRRYVEIRIRMQIKKTLDSRVFTFFMSTRDWDTPPTVLILMRQEELSTHTHEGICKAVLMSYSQYSHGALPLNRCRITCRTVCSLCFSALDFRFREQAPSRLHVVLLSGSLLQHASRVCVPFVGCCGVHLRCWVSC